MNDKRTAIAVILVHAGLLATVWLIMGELGTADSDRSPNPFRAPGDLDPFHYRLAIYALIAISVFIGVVFVSVWQLSRGASWLTVVPYVCPLLAAEASTAVPLLMGFAFALAFVLLLAVQPLVCLTASLSLQFRRRSLADTVSMYLGYLYFVGVVIWVGYAFLFAWPRR
jgi:hypothetical protein